MNILSKIQKFYSIDYATHVEIDKYNILQATQRSMHNSVRNIINQITENKKDEVVDILNRIKICVDGNYFNTFQYFYHDKIYLINHECMIKGMIYVKK